jgi:hypothetical protein
MPTKQIVPPIPVWGGYGTGVAEQQLLECFNNSGATLAQGDVVVVDNSAGQMPAVVAGAPNGATGAVTTSTTAQDPKTVGVVSIDGTSNTNGGIIQPGGTCWVCVCGIARVQIGANTVAAGAALAQSGTAKQASTPATPAVNSNIGAALEAQTAKDANNTIRAFIKVS